MRYTVYSDRAMTIIRQEVDTQNPEVVDAVHDELRSAGVLAVETLQLPFSLASVGIVIHEL